MDRAAAMTRADTPRAGAMTAVIVTALYAAIVVWGAAHHEPWRDEVVPLSIARHATSPCELVAALRFEGHPILWYVVLWIGYGMLAQTWVLKAASVASAVGGVWLLNRGPLPWWIRWPFTFSLFPLYQYSVVSRGYALEMLFLFAFCALFRRRRDRPLAVALVLAALANTETFGFVMAVAAGIMVAVERIVDLARGRDLTARGPAKLAVVVYLAGLLLAATTAFPASTHPLAGFRDASVGTVAGDIARAIVRPTAHSDWYLFAVLPIASVWVWAYLAYLAWRPPVLCFALAALVGIETFFNLVYGAGAPWHLGNVMLVLVAAAWIDAAEPAPSDSLPRARRWLGWVVAAGVVAVLADHALLGFRHLSQDLRYGYSANRAFAELLHDDPALADAVVMGEPDVSLWSLPYYADNRIYLAREQVFRSWGVFGPARARAYDLDSLLSSARRVHAECGCPVVITSGWQLDTPGTFANFRGTYAEETFTITQAARDDFLAATRRLARLGPTITDENYDVYRLR